MADGDDRDGQLWGPGDVGLGRGSAQRGRARDERRSTDRDGRARQNRKVELLTWAEYNVDTLRRHQLFATGTTGALLEYELELTVHQFLSGPMGCKARICMA